MNILIRFYRKVIRYEIRDDKNARTAHTQLRMPMNDHAWSKFGQDQKGRDRVEY